MKRKCIRKKKLRVDANPSAWHTINIQGGGTSIRLERCFVVALNRAGGIAMTRPTVDGDRFPSLRILKLRILLNSIMQVGIFPRYFMS